MPFMKIQRASHKSHDALRPSQVGNENTSILCFLAGAELLEGSALLFTWQPVIRLPTTQPRAVQTRSWGCTGLSDSVQTFLLFTHLDRGQTCYQHPLMREERGKQSGRGRVKTSPCSPVSLLHATWKLITKRQKRENKKGTNSTSPFL